MLVDFVFDKGPKLLHLPEGVVVGAREVIHQLGEEVVHLWGIEETSELIFLLKSRPAVSQ